MPRPELAPDLRRFIVTNIPSVPYLEAILLLRSQPQRGWTARDMAGRLYVGEAQAAALLDASVNAGIAARVPDTETNTDSSIVYQPATPELAQMLDRLATHYASDVITVATLIHHRPPESTPAQQFADAFRWRKES